MNFLHSSICKRASKSSEENRPGLTLDATSSDVAKGSLTVEIVWHITCIEVTNIDAFKVDNCLAFALRLKPANLSFKSLKVDLRSILVILRSTKHSKIIYNLQGKGYAIPSDQEQTPILPY